MMMDALHPAEGGRATDQDPAEGGRATEETALPVQRVLEAFPRSVPPALTYSGPESESSRYVLPFLLVGLVALVLLFSYWSTERPVDLSPTIVATPQLTDDLRLAEAEKLIARGDQLWDQGYRGWNDKTLLAESAIQYREAWYLLTGHMWNSATHAANASVSPTHDSPRARVLVNKVRNRLFTLEETLL